MYTVREREFQFGSDILCSIAAESLQRGLVQSRPESQAEGVLVISSVAVSVMF